MRTISAEHERVFASGNYSSHVRVSVKDSGGTWRDLSTYGGVNWIDAVELSESVDEPHRTATITLKREVNDLSLAPLMESSPLNLGFAYPGTYAALIDAGREVKVEAGLGFEGEASPVEWLLVFHGYIDEPDWGADAGITLECRDLAAELADTFIEKDRAYGIASGTGGLLVWKLEEPFALGALMTPQNPTGFYYKCTVAGTSGATEPVWPTTLGATVADGSVTWVCEAATSASTPLETVIQQLFSDSATGETLYTPTSPGWALGQYAQDRTTVLAAALALVEQIGWDLRYKWRASSGAFEPTLYEPDRAKTTPDRTFTAAQYASVTRCAVSRANVRNVIRVWYRDTADRLPSGEAKRKLVEVSDSASITRFGRKFAEASEEGSANINTSTEATKLANALLSDLAWPLSEFEVGGSFAPFVECGDLYRFSANGRHFSVDQDRAVVAWNWSFSGGSASTTYSLRGKPSGGYIKWAKKMAWPTVNLSHKNSLLPGGSVAASGTGTLEGGKMTLAPPAPSLDASVNFDGAEFHVSTAAGFAPSSSTLVASGKQRNVEVHGLKPGTTYFAKAVPRGLNDSRIIRGTPTAEVSFVAGQLTEQHFNADLGLKPGPLNGGFESYWNVDTIADHWEMVTGVYGSTRDAFRSATSRSGVYAMELRATAVATKIRSAFFPVPGSATFDLHCWLQRVNDAALTWTVTAEWYDSAKVLISTSTLLTQSNTALGAGWVKKQLAATAPATAAFAQIAFAKDSADATYGLLIDEVALVPVAEAWHGVGAAGEPPFENSWVNFDATWNSAGFFKDANGTVYLKGLVKSGPISATLAIFTLPVGYRPTTRRSTFATISNNVIGRINVQPDGKVIPEVGNTAWISLDGLSFRTNT